MSELIPLGAGHAPRGAGGVAGVTETQGRAPSSGQRAWGTRRARRVLCRGAQADAGGRDERPGGAWGARLRGPDGPLGSSSRLRESPPGTVNA